MKHFSIFFLFLLNILHANAQIEVKAVSAMKPVMMGTDLSAHVRLDTLASLPHLFAVCPLDRLEGEITILDGKIYKSRVGKKNKIVTDNEFIGTAPFMVYAQVKDWKKFEITATIQSEKDLEQLIQNLALENGYDTSIAFPFMVKGNFEKVKFHIISKPLKEKSHNHELHHKAKKHFEHIQTVGTLLGFYSRHHEGVFTHKGSFTHVHYTDDEGKATGHVESVHTTSTQLTIYLPELIQGLGSLNLNTIDTDFSKGRLKNQQNITVQDVARFHGHLCDGLVLGFIGLKEALNSLFPDSVIDRTNLRIVSKSSPCISDIAVYLTGGRYQFNTYYTTDALPYLFVVQRIDNGKAIGINVLPEIVPKEIKEMGTQAVKGNLDACGLDQLRSMENDLIVKLMNSKVNQLFVFTELPDFQWNSPLEKTFLKSDVINKNKETCH